jgi:hypothetical protein
MYGLYRLLISDDIVVIIIIIDLMDASAHGSSMDRHRDDDQHESSDDFRVCDDELTSEADDVDEEHKRDDQKDVNVVHWSFLNGKCKRRDELA